MGSELPISRLYIAEGIACAVEVKSNICTQWDEVVRTAEALSILNKSYGPGFSSGPIVKFKKIPLFAVGYTGWNNIETVVGKLSRTSLSGILVIDPGIFVSTKELDGLHCLNETSLWGFICCIHKSVSVSTNTTVTIPAKYIF